jgi:hypothetical protein
MGRWWSRKVRRRPVTDGTRKSLAAVMRETPGLWIAVDRATNELREVADSPYQLAAKIRERGLKNVTMLRSPDVIDPEMVGFG